MNLPTDQWPLNASWCSSGFT